MSDRHYLKLVKTSLIFVYLVIIAGSVVRMTGSGMGCPDWPKCFGHLIPPTDESQVYWQAGRSFEEGQMIIREEQLWVAQAKFTSGDTFYQNNWAVYEKHDYAHFNVLHTWVEYINRMATVLLGFPLLLTAFFSLWYIRKRILVTILAFMALFATGFEAWLGKRVVDGNLIPGQITIHMIAALFIIAFLIALLSNIQRNTSTYSSAGKGMHWLLITVLVLSLIQIVSGTQVREQVDEIALSFGHEQRALWIGALGNLFYVHRSFAILLVLTNALLVYRAIKEKWILTLPRAIFAVLIIEVVSGIVMAYMGIPAFLQPVHLFFGTVLFGIQFYLLLRYRTKPSPLPLSENAVSVQESIPNER